MSRFLNEADPLHELSVDERNRRAAQLKKAYFTRLALKSSLARSRARK